MARLKRSNIQQPPRRCADMSEEELNQVAIEAEQASDPPKRKRWEPKPGHVPQVRLNYPDRRKGKVGEVPCRGAAKRRAIRLAIETGQSFAQDSPSVAQSPAAARDVQS